MFLMAQRIKGFCGAFAAAKALLDETAQRSSMGNQREMAVSGWMVNRFGVEIKDIKSIESKPRGCGTGGNGGPNGAWQDPYTPEERTTAGPPGRCVVGERGRRIWLGGKLFMGAPCAEEEPWPPGSASPGGTRGTEGGRWVLAGLLRFPEGRHWAGRRRGPRG